MCLPLDESDRTDVRFRRASPHDWDAAYSKSLSRLSTLSLILLLDHFTEKKLQLSVAAHILHPSIAFESPQS